MFHCHLDNKHGLHLEVGKSSCPSIHPRGPRQQNHGSMNARILNNHMQGKSKWKETPWSNEEESKIKVGWTSNPSTTNGTN